MFNSTNTNAILESLEPMFKEADEKRLWFYLEREGSWFTPDELRKCHIEERFIWGPPNWILRDPMDEVKLLECRKRNIENQLETFKIRIQKSYKK